MIFNIKVFFCFTFLFTFLSITTSAKENYFYTGKDYGSEALYNPIYVVLNNSYDIIQLEGHMRDVFHFPYSIATTNLFRNLKDPFSVINKNGWDNFISNELFPIHLTKKGAQWWPNYQLHLIGGGMNFTKLREWYKDNGFPQPYISAAATTMFYHILNEVIEIGEYKGWTVDPVSDIYFFDIGGIVLFSFDNINEFFSKTLNMADWSLQPSFSLRNMYLHNCGQYFSLRWELPFYKKMSLFYYFGMNALGGLSYHLNEEESITFGAGLRAKKNEVVDSVGRKLTVQTVWNAGLFYDRNNSLMASVFFSGMTDYFCNINIYPGIVRIGNFSPGLWFVINRDFNILFGISTRFGFGLGVG